MNKNKPISIKGIIKDLNPEGNRLNLFSDGLLKVSETLESLPYFC